MIVDMSKFSKRELAIFGVTALVVLFGAFSLLSGGSGKKAAGPAVKKTTDLQTLSSDVATAMGKQIISARDAYVIARAETDWQRDPFFERKAYREMVSPPPPEKEAPKAAVAEPKKATTFHYTGYMEFGGKKIAIINGVEYTLGEALETPGYVLKSIAADKVSIENNASRARIEIPLQE